METTEVPAVRHEDTPKAGADAPDTAQIPGAGVTYQNTQSAAANSSLKDLSLNSFTEPLTNNLSSSQPPTSSATVTTNGVNGISSANSLAANVNGSVTEATPAITTTETTVTSAPADDGDTVMTIEYSESPTEATSSSDPTVQQPTSDLRGPTEPVVSAEQVNEIKEAKQLSDLASDRGLATGMAESSDAPIERAITPAETAPSGDAMDATTTVPPTAGEASITDIDIPHHPPVPTVEGALSETPVDPAPTPKEAIKPSPTPTLPPPFQEQDTTMADAPPSPGKVARNREEEEDDEPATKRLKAADDGAIAEFKVPDAPPAVPEPATGESKPADEPAPGSVSARVKKPEHEKPMTPAQKKYILQKVLGILKRAKYSLAFKLPVDPVALGIPTYFDHIQKPMDLKTIEEKLKADQYGNMSEVWDDLEQIVQNSVIFNGPNHGVTIVAYQLREAFDKYMAGVPSAEFIEPSAADKKAKRASIEKQPTRRRESRSSGGNAKSPVAQSPTQTFALNPAGMPTIRRDSTITDGRPRREIHPPAPKDLPYSNQRPRKKKYQWELKWCQDVLNEFKKPKYHGLVYAFQFPVDPVALNIPTYHKVIKKPMDLSTMENKLKTGEYENAKDFEADMKLMFQNCYKFNPPDDAIHKAGKNLEALYDERADGRKDWIKDHAPANAQSPASSDEESEEEEEEEEEEDDSGDDSAVQQINSLEKQLEALKHRVNQESKKKKTPPVKTKKAKKGGKPTKKEAAVPTKKSKGGKADKKESKSKKQTKAPYVTYEQKQDISARINNLPENRMATALSIIRDNMPNLKGVQDDEIELDIDELSNEVLHKLLTFVRKYAPYPDDEPIPRAAPAPAATSSRPKKAKPMGKHEQEARIRELKEKLNGVGSEESEGAQQAVESSGDEEDSEESEED